VSGVVADKKRKGVVRGDAFCGSREEVEGKAFQKH
jgi:hypothetical protein